MGNRFEQKLAQVLEEDERYSREAYLFLFQALEFTLQQQEERRHISGQELLEGIRRYAAETYGPTAKLVFDHWGIRDTLDFGNMVFNLVNHELLAKTEDDTLDDFRGGFDFKTVFEDEYAWTME